MRKSIIFFAFVFMTSFAQANTQDPYYQITSMQIETLSEEQLPLQAMDSKSVDQIGDIIAKAKQLIAFGKEIYEIVKAGKPVITSSYTPISVLPLNSTHGETIVPADLSNWKAPISKKFKVTYKNGYGSEVVALIYNVNMSYGGSLDGKGAYIANAQVVPELISVAWGYKFDVKMSLTGLTNLGSEDSPVAGATLQLAYTVSTLIKEERNNITLFISGDGDIKNL